MTAGPPTRDPPESADTDAHLLSRVRSGDRAAYGLLWARHVMDGRRVARSLTSVMDPEDLVSEAFAGILETIDRGAGPVDGFRPYLYVAMKNIAVSAARRRLVTRPLEAHDIADVTVPDHTEHIALREEVRHALARLPHGARSLVWLTVVEGYTPAELAPAFGISANTVAVRTHRARLALRSMWAAATGA